MVGMIGAEFKPINYESEDGSSNNLCHIKIVARGCGMDVE